MTPERWLQIKDLYYRAVALESSERAILLDEARWDDQEMRSKVGALIAASEQPKKIIVDRQAIEVAAELMQEDSSGSLSGRAIGHYRVISLIGEGGMGKVYLAQDERLGRRVALKLLPARFTQDEDRVRRFQQEARAVSALNHPNILTIHDIGQTDSTHFIATEFVEGHTLRSYIATGGRRLSESLGITIQVAGAIAVAHQAGIVHRDIKPENIMLRPDGYVKVLDFGLAKLFEPEATHYTAATLMEVRTDPGMIMGTVAYMSPEQIRGLALDVRTDIFSLGVVLYEMLTGQAPFQGTTKSDLIVAILEKEPVPLKRYWPELPDELQRIVSKALCKDKEGRYQTAKEMLGDLRKLKERLEAQAKLKRNSHTESSVAGTAARSASASGQTRVITDNRSGRHTSETVTQDTSSSGYLARLVKRHKKTGTLVLATLTLAVAGILLDAQLMRPQSGVIDSIAVLPFVNSGGDESREYLSDVVTDSLINSLAQLPQLRVMAGTAVFNYKGKEVDPIKVGSELNVRAVLIGSLKQKGENLTINVELVDTLDGSHIWGDQFDAKPSNILSMQKEITQRIINRLEIKLSGDEKRRLTKNHTDNVDAYNAYLQGRYHMKKLTEAGNKLAIESFKKAIEIDQNYALAYVGLADCYMITGQTEMREMLTTALMLDYTLAEAHATLATAYFIIDWNWAAAEQEFTEAIKLNSNYPNTHYWYAFYLLAMQQTHKAVSEMKRALELDPLSLNINYEMGNIFYHARLFSDAREQIQETLVLDPNYFPAHLLLGQILLQEGRNEDAIIEIKRAISLERTGNTLAILAYAYAVSGRWDEALKMLKTEPIMRGYYKAAAYAALGQEDEAFKYLERSLMVRDGLMVYLRADPKLDSLRSDPRFASLLRRMHFQN